MNYNYFIAVNRIWNVLQTLNPKFRIYSTESVLAKNTFVYLSIPFLLLSFQGFSQSKIVSIEGKWSLYKASLVSEKDGRTIPYDSINNYHIHKVYLFDKDTCTINNEVETRSIYEIDNNRLTINYGVVPLVYTFECATNKLVLEGYYYDIDPDDLEYSIKYLTHLFYLKDQ